MFLIAQEAVTMARWAFGGIGSMLDLAWHGDGGGRAMDEGKK